MCNWDPDTVEAIPQSHNEEGTGTQVTDTVAVLWVFDDLENAAAWVSMAAQGQIPEQKEPEK